MTEELDLLAEATTGLLRRARAKGTAPTDLWRRLASAGLVDIGVPETLGGSGGDLEAAATVVYCCARFAETVELPIGSTLFLGHWLRASAGLSVDLAPTAVVQSPGLELHQSAQGLAVSGSVDRIAGAGLAESFLLLARDATASHQLISVGPGNDRAALHVSADPVREGIGLGRITVDHLPLGEQQVRHLPEMLVEQLDRRCRLLSVVQLAGVLDEVVDLTMRYASERQQFGRPIRDFQMIKQMLALIAGEVATVGAAMAGAVAAIDAPDAELAIRAAQLRAARAAATVAQLSHQVHGTIGMTSEYPLHRYTKQLWHWRDTAGTDGERELGALVAARGPDGFWPAVVGG